MMPNWIVNVELEWPALPGEDAEQAWARLRPALKALLMTMHVLHGEHPHYHRLGMPRLGELVCGDCGAPVPPSHRSTRRCDKCVLAREWMMQNGIIELKQP
jgi:hypothetical protein